MRCARARQVQLMDNVTHTLVGALVGEAIARVGPKHVEFTQRRCLFVPVLAIGSNLPDVDLLYTTLVHGKLDYLLHHRGHSHTLVGAVSLSLLLVGLYEWLWKRRAHAPSRSERISLLGVALLGPLLHIAMDATNSYGVHPYWPFDNRWRYGDAVFIIEPLFWAAAAPLVLLLQSAWARGAVASILVAGVGLAVGTGMVPLALVVIYVCVTLAMLFVAHRAPRSAALLGTALWLIFTAIFCVSGQIATRRVQSLLTASFPHERVLDAMRSPMPMNPVCWEVMLVQMPDEAHFTVRRAVLSLAPRLWSAAACPTRGLSLPTSAPLQPVNIAISSAIEWHGELTMPRESLRRLVASRCEASALMQFARIPWLQWDAHGWRVGDLRYDREREPGFAEIHIANGSTPECPLWGAPWIPARQDLLR